MMPIALITGASAGIGAEFARQLSNDGYDLVLVARDKKRLVALAKKLPTKCEVLSADLTDAGDVERVIKRLTNPKKPIDVLINNAGFGLNRSFTSSDRDDEISLLDVLVNVPMQFTHAIVPLMKERGQGIVINVSSIAGFMAGGSYSAAKSYLTVLSESLHTELRGTGVNVHALCPGFTRTEFHQRGKFRMDKLPNFMWLRADRVVADAWQSARAGKAISIPGIQYKVLSFVMRYFPRSIIRSTGTNVRSRQRR